MVDDTAGIGETKADTPMEIRTEDPRQIMNRP
jgi:hypothetical protein